MLLPIGLAEERARAASAVVRALIVANTLGALVFLAAEGRHGNKRHRLS